MVMTLAGARNTDFVARQVLRNPKAAGSGGGGSDHDLVAIGLWAGAPGGLLLVGGYGFAAFKYGSANPWSWGEKNTAVAEMLGSLL